MALASVFRSFLLAAFEIETELEDAAAEPAETLEAPASAAPFNMIMTDLLSSLDRGHEKATTVATLAYGIA